MSDSIGSAYVDIRAKGDKVKGDMDNIKSDILEKGKEIETSLQSIRANIDIKAASMKMSELKQLQTELSNKLKEQISMNVNFGDLQKTQTELEAVKDKIASVKDTVEKLPKEKEGWLSKIFGGEFSMEGIISKIGAAAAAFFAFEKIASFAKDSVEAFDGREKALLGVDSIIHSMGKETEFTSDAVLKLAQNIAAFNKNSVKVNDVLDLQGYLLTLDSMNNDKLPRATQLVVDLAAKMKTDLVSAGRAVGIVSEDVEGGLNRFRRAGIVFSDTQKGMIKNLVDTGDKTGALNKVFDLLEQKVGGYARNTTTALETVQNKLSASFGVLERWIGGALAPVASFAGILLTGLLPAAEKTATALQDANEKGLQLSTNFNILTGRFLELSATQNKSEEQQQAWQETADELNKNYPNYLKNINLYKDSIDKVKEAFTQAKVELDKYINSLVIAAMVKDLTDKAVNVGKKIKSYDIGLADNKAEVNKPITDIKASDQSLDEHAANVKKSFNQLATAQVTMLTKEKDSYLEQIKKLQEQMTVAIPPNNGGGNGNTPKKPDDGKDDTKSDLEAKYALMEAEAQLQRDAIKDKYQREKQAADDSYKLEMTKLNDKYTAEEISDKAYRDSKAALDDKLIHERSAAEENHNKDQEKAAQELIDKKIAWDKQYITWTASVEKDSVDQQIKNYTLSLADYKVYLEKMLALRIKELEDENKKIAENNAKYGTNYAPINIPQAQQDGQKENNTQSGTYSKEQLKKRIEDWKKSNKEIYDAGKQLNTELIGGWADTLKQMANGTMNFGDGIKAMFSTIWTTIENVVIDSLGKILEAYVENVALQKIVGASGAAANTAVGIGTAGTLTAAYSTPAMLASIMSFGAADVAGATGFASAVALAKGINMVPAFANGGDFIVPPGYDRDDFLMRAQTGERVTITPRAQVNNENNSGNTASFRNMMQGMTMSLVNVLSRGNNKGPGAVVINVDGKTLAKIQIQNENKLGKTGYNFNEYNN